MPQRGIREENLFAIETSPPLMPTNRAISPRRRSRRRAIALILALVVTAGITPAVIASADSPATDGIFAESLTPAKGVDEDRVSVELGVVFTSTRPGTITGLQFYRSSAQEKSYTGTLWSNDGTALATAVFPASSDEGWQTAALNTPVSIAANVRYVASYLASDGSYAVTENAFDGRYRSNGFIVPSNGGVYDYGRGAFPTRTYRGSNYLVDVVFAPDGTTPNPSATPTPTPSATPSPDPTPTASPTPTPTPTASPTPTPTPTASPTPTPTASPTPTPTSSPTPTPTPTPTPGGSGGTLDLPRIPWEGGPAYWSRFSDAKEWTDPSFFPIGIWYNGISTDAEVKWDKDHGINTYAGMWEGTDFSLFEDNDVYWLGGKLNSTFKDRSPNWPGVFMDDEVDGRYTPREGLSFLRSVAAQWAGSGKFTYTNYTQLVIGSDMALGDQQSYVNLPDAVSLDMYWYTIPFCDWTPYRGNLYADPVSQATCRTASSYGKAMNGLTLRDASDGVLHPRWMFLENLNGLSGQAHVGYVSPGQLKGAAMSSIINEARGLMWFNQPFSGSCQASSALRQAQVQGSKFCGYAQMEAMGEVNNLILDLAPVINTQSYQWSFGSGLDTMLKTYDGDAYVFAMTDGTTGARTFTLPAGVKGATVEVVGENRTIPVNGGTFSDSFGAEYTYHVYRVSLD